MSTHVRIPDELHERITALAAELATAYNAGRTRKVVAPVTAGTVIRLAIDEYIDHRRRGRRTLRTPSNPSIPGDTDQCEPSTSYTSTTPSITPDTTSAQPHQSCDDSRPTEPVTVPASHATSSPRVPHGV